jgi:hypothetical protein
LDVADGGGCTVVNDRFDAEVDVLLRAHNGGADLFWAHPGGGLRRRVSGMGGAVAGFNFCVFWNA